MSPLVLTSGRFDLRAIMHRAVGIARLGDGPWRRRMVAGLRFAWSMAKAEKYRERAVAAKPVDPRLVLDRPAVLRLIGRMKAHRKNHRRDLLSTAERLNDLPALLAFAREEFAKLPAVDRPGILAGIGQAEPAPEPVVFRRARFGGPGRGNAFIRGSRAHSHGW